MEDGTRLLIHLKLVQMIRDDIKLAKSEYGLKYVLMSVGGQNNTFTLNNIDSTA